MRNLLVTFLLLSLVPLAAQAQSPVPVTHRRYELTVFAGGSFVGDKSMLTPVSGGGQSPFRTVGLSYATGTQFGMRVAENRWKHWGAVLEYSYSNQPFTFKNLTDAAPSLTYAQSIHRFLYDVAFYPLDRSHRLRPFAFAGAGVSLYQTRGSSNPGAETIHLNSPWKFTSRWGGGVKYLILDQVAVTLQYSNYISGVPGYGLPESGSIVSGQYVPGFKPDGLLQNRVISLGFTYQWGSR